MLHPTFRPLSLSGPLYLQARDLLARRIAAGEWKPETTLPSEYDLARELRVSPGTLRKALELLEADRLISRRSGVGTVVIDQRTGPAALRYSRLQTPDGEPVEDDVDVLATVTVAANQPEAARLGLRQPGHVHRMQRLRRVRGKPYMLETVAMPVDLFPSLAADKPVAEPILGHAQEAGVALGGAHELVALRAPSSEAAAALQVPPGYPTVMLDRVIYTLDGRPAEWRFAECAFDGLRYVSSYR